MGILLIESSSKKIEFGFVRGNEVLINQTLEQKDNADNLTFFIKSAFDKNKIGFEEIEYVSLSNGPGSFTGLRIGSSIAKGICFAKGSKLIEIPTLDIIANKYKQSEKVSSLIYSNSRTNEYYFCRYLYESSVLKRISDYKSGYLEDIISGKDTVYLMNKTDGDLIPEKYSNLITDVSDISGIQSQAELTKAIILDNSFSDYKSSQPFYMKEFVPNN